MAYTIIIDEAALTECVESNLYQSSHFETGEKLAKAISGNKTVTAIAPRLTAIWRKGGLYLLQSRIETGYLIFSSDVFTNISTTGASSTALDDTLTVFQRVCRFALKMWNHLSFSSPVEKWSPKTNYGVVFPYPKSKHTGFRVTVRLGYDDPRITTRHGHKHLYAFASGTDGDVTSTTDHERQYKRAFDNLHAVRSSITVQIERITTVPQDTGYHSLVLSSRVQSAIKFQDYERWLARLTTEQARFVTSPNTLPQKVEGPAGTGKTLCLLLRAFFLCKSAEEIGTDCKVLFVAHSEATKNAIAVQFETLGEPYYLRNKDEFAQAIELKTLQEWCGDLLGERDLASAQYLDQDALAAKEMRRLLLKDVVNERRKQDQGSLKYLSRECGAFFEQENIEYIAELLQHEIAIMIKGRASENLENYLTLPYLTYGLPTKSEDDRRFVFSLYKRYQEILNLSGVYDTDDIVLTALGRLDTPIWRRRRLKEGYNAVMIDETHLFNLNELSVFHYLLTDATNPRIIFSIDRSQAPGERGITTKYVKEILTGNGLIEQETKTKLVFRNSPNIVRLAEAITSAGATLFTTFENPLIGVSTVIPATEEVLAQVPIYWSCENDIEMCKWVIERVKGLCNQMKCPASDILIVSMSGKLLPLIRQTLVETGRKFVEIIHRGDLEVVRKGEREGAVILAHPDYVGGLEFKAVLIMGVDEGRVPPSEGSVREESQHFLQFT